MFHVQLGIIIVFKELLPPIGDFMVANKVLLVWLVDI
jgi:hypothetical protein